MKKLAKLFLGFSIAAIGVLWILNVTGVIGFDIFFRDWWTLLIILPCTAHLIAHPNWGSFSGIALGAILLLQAQGYIDWSVFWKLCLAIIFIAFGIMLIFFQERPSGELELPRLQRRLLDHLPRWKEYPEDLIGFWRAESSCRG